MPFHKFRTFGFAACALACSLWGCGFYFGKIALTEINVGAMVLYRFLFATMALASLLVLRRPRFCRKDWGLLLLTSFLGIPLQFLIQFSGLARTTVSHASLMVGTMPVLLGVGATLFAHERMDRMGWFALLLSTLGATLIALGARNSTGATRPTIAGDMLVVASMFIGLSWTLLNKRLLARNTPIAVTAYGVAVGTAMLLALVPLIYRQPFGPQHIAQVSLKVWLALIASGLLCTASTTLLWNWGLTQVPAAQAGVLCNLEPLIGSLLGVLLLGESLGPSARTGGAMILAAALIITMLSHTRGREQLSLTRSGPPPTIL